MTADTFRESLLASGWLADGGLPGVYHRSFAFERLARSVGDAVSALGESEPSARLHLGPLLPRDTLERSGYVTSFPDLVGVVASFAGTEADVPALLEAVEAGGSWLDHTAATDVSLCSAGCHPIYPAYAGSVLPEDGVVVEVETWCFRHEPSLDPARMQCFRQHEFVHLGTADGAAAHRDRWLERGRMFLASLALDVAVVVANDPFFGRGGRLLAANQRTKELKFELVAPISSDTLGAAASANLHESHFGIAFGIEAADRTPAHTACIGFGLERITLALLRRHGLDVDEWPADVRGQLALDRARRAAS